MSLSWEDVEATGYLISGMVALPFTVRAVVVLGVPDILAEAGPDAKLTAEEIASRIATRTADSATLDRLLRLLVSHNVMTELVSASTKDPNIVERRYGMAPIMRCLVKSIHGGLTPLLLLLTSPQYIASQQYLHAPVLNPNSPEPFALAHGKGQFELMKTDSELQKLFVNAMGGATDTMVPRVLETFKGLEGLSSLVDVGGGVGESLARILSKYPHLRGINFDQPHIVARGLQVPRLEHVGGDFFESVPAADAVWMKWILHDWSDELCVKILKNVAKALPPHGKVINMDVLLPEISDPSPDTRSGLSNDILMFAYCAGGKERTLRQFQKIAAEAGFPRVEVALTVANHGILEFHKI